MPSRIVGNVQPDDLDILRLAGAHYRLEGHRLVEARERFGLRPAEFYQRVVQLLDDPEAELAEPQLVARLRRLAARKLRRTA